MLSDSAEEEGLDSGRCESSSSTLKYVVKVARPSPAPWDTDVDSQLRKCSKKDSTWGERGQSWEMDRQGRYSRDRSDSGLRDECHRDWEHYWFRMQDKAEYLHSPPSLGSATGAHSQGE